MIFLTILVCIIIFGILIFVHEFFHFIAAKRSGVRVEEFGFGYPPRLFGVFKEKNKWKTVSGPKKVETESTIYSLNLIPFGGFNKIYGMEGGEGLLSSQPEKKTGSFREKNIGTRAKIIVAGVVGNFVLAVIVFSAGFYFGLPQVIEGEIPQGATDVAVQIISVNNNSPAQAADIKLGDKIIEVRSLKPGTQKEIKEIKALQEFTQENLGEPIILTVKRGDKILEKEITPRENPPEGEGSMGIGLAKTARVSYPWYSAILRGIQHTFLLGKTIIEIFFEIIKGAFIGKPVTGAQVTGPIGVSMLVSDMLELGWIYVLNITGILSLNLIILNLLPFPALDGGYLLLLLIEKIKKTPVKIETENIINQIGFIILIILMVIVTFKDIQKFF